MTAVPLRRVTEAVAGAGAALFFLGSLARLTVVDLDVFHELALWREARQLGHLPEADSFAFTPTRRPVVHHEWLTGAVLYETLALGGPPLLMALKYALSAGVVGLTVAAARRRGAPWPLVLLLAPAAVAVGNEGFATVRAQLFTLLGLAWVLWWLARPPTTVLRAVAAWAPAQVVWQNLHAGFVAGALAVACRAAEGLFRPDRSLKPLLAVAALAVPLAAVHPFGLAYPLYVLHGVTMPRPEITEWLPVWRHDGTIAASFAGAALLAGYAAARTTADRAGGLFLLAAAVQATLHVRHGSLFAVAWLALVPAWLAATPLGRLLLRLWDRYPAMVVLLFGTLGAAGGVRAVADRFWEPVVPNAPLAADGLHYPVGAVRFLGERGRPANVLTPFDAGSYVSWKLAPAVKVSYDSRYEVAYPAAVFDDHQRLYWARAGFEETLQKYAATADYLLVPAARPLAGAMARRAPWRLCYHDEAWQLYEKAAGTVEADGAVDGGAVPPDRRFHEPLTVTARGLALPPAGVRPAPDRPAPAGR